MSELVEALEEFAGELALEGYEGKFNLIHHAAERIEQLEAGLKWYANPEIYKPHPHGIGFDDRDLSFHARALLKDR